MAKKRSVREQVISGLRIGGLTVMCFIFFVAMVVSASLITGREATSHIEQKSLGIIAIAILAGVLWFTAHRWTEWLVGILGYCLLRFSGALLFGPYLRKPISRFQAATWMLYLLVALLLTMRHVKRHPRGTEKLGLVGFVICVPFAISLQSYKPLVFGLLLLVLGERSEKLRLWNTRHRRPRNDQPIVPV